MSSLEKIRSFALFRYQLLPRTRSVQRDMFSKVGIDDIASVNDLRRRKNELFAEALVSLESLNYRKKKINLRFSLKEEPWYAFKVNIGKTTKRERADFRDEEIDIWPHTTLFVNNQAETQVLAIEDNKRAFSSPVVLSKIFERNLNRVLAPYYLTIHVEPIFRERDFWRLINAYRGRIRYLEFELIAPNMSNISETLKVDLAGLNAETNSQKINLKLNSNNNSVLEISKSHEVIGSLAQYAADGGGDIKIKVKGVRRVIRTSKDVREVSIDEVAAENLSAEDLEALLKTLGDD